MDNCIQTYFCGIILPAIVFHIWPESGSGVKGAAFKSLHLVLDSLGKDYSWGCCQNSDKPASKDGEASPRSVT